MRRLTLFLLLLLLATRAWAGSMVSAADPHVCCPSAAMASTQVCAHPPRSADAAAGPSATGVGLATNCCTATKDCAQCHMVALVLGPCALAPVTRAHTRPQLETVIYVSAEARRTCRPPIG